MRSGPGAVLCAVVLPVLLLAGCGNAASPGPDDGDSDVPADTASPDGDDNSSADGAPDDTVVGVKMTQRGGLAGIVRSWRITEGSPHHERVFETATRRALESPGARTRGRTPCCDLLEYEVLVQYADGSTKRLRTWDADDTNPGALALVTAVIDTEPWHLDGGRPTT